MTKEKAPSSMAFIIPETTVKLLQKNAARVKKLFNVDINIPDSIEQGNTKIQWVLFDKGDATDEEMRHAKTYVMSMTNPIVCDILENQSSSAYKSHLDAIELNSRAFLTRKGKRVTIGGSQLAVFMAKSMLKRVEQSEEPEQDISEKALATDADTPKVKKKKKKDKAKRALFENGEAMEVVEENGVNNGENKTKKRKSVDGDVLEGKQKKLKKGKGLKERDMDVNARVEETLQADEETGREDHELDENGEKENGWISQVYQLDPSAKFMYAGRAGPSDARVKVMTVTVKKQVFEGTGSSKKLAKRAAAKKALRVMSGSQSSSESEGVVGTETSGKQRNKEGRKEKAAKVKTTSTKTSDKKVKEEGREEKKKKRKKNRMEETESDVVAPRKEEKKEKRKKRKTTDEIEEESLNTKQRECGEEKKEKGKKNRTKDISDSVSEKGKEEIENARKEKKRRRGEIEEVVEDVTENKKRRKVSVVETEIRRVKKRVSDAEERGEHKEEYVSKVEAVGMEEVEIEEGGDQPTDMESSRKPVKLLSRLVPDVRFLMVSKSGPLDNPLYVMSVKVNEKTFEGTGSSKKSAKQAAAREALKDVSEAQPIQDTLPTSALDAGKRQLRPIVIDGNNVGRNHGHHRSLSAKGIQICVDYFLARGHKVTAFISGTQRYFNPWGVTDRFYLEKLEIEGFLKTTPSRRLDTGQIVSSYDDRYILNLAEIQGAIIVSNDQYRDLLSVKPAYREIIENRLLPYMFVDDIFLPPDDPLGRDGPSLDEFLLVGGSQATALEASHNSPRSTSMIQTTPNYQSFHRTPITLSDSSGKNRSALHTPLHHTPQAYSPHCDMTTTGGPDDSGALDQYNVLRKLGLKHQFKEKVVEEALKHTDMTKAIHPDEFIDFIRFFDSQQDSA